MSIYEHSVSIEDQLPTETQLRLKEERLEELSNHLKHNLKKNRRNNYKMKKIKEFLRNFFGDDQMNSIMIEAGNYAKEQISNKNYKGK